MLSLQSNDLDIMTLGSCLNVGASVVMHNPRLINYISSGITIKSNLLNTTQTSCLETSDNWVGLFLSRFKHVSHLCILCYQASCDVSCGCVSRPIRVNINHQFPFLCLSLSCCQITFNNISQSNSICQEYNDDIDLSPFTVRTCAVVSVAVEFMRVAAFAEVPSVRVNTVMLAQT